MNVSSLFNDDEKVKPLAGEIPMEVPVSVASRRQQRVAVHRARSHQPSSDFIEDTESEREDMAPEARQLTRDDVDEVERELEELCSSIVNEWNMRMKPSPLAVATVGTFGNPMEIETMEIDICVHVSIG